MTKKKWNDDYKKLLEALALFPKGVALDELMAHLNLSIPKRTLQRHLSILSKEGYLHIEGNARARRYRIAENEAVLQEKQAPLLSLQPAITLSPVSLTLIEQIHQSIQKRSPISYNRAFLDHYRPNVSFYLPSSTRAHLLALGKPAQESEKPAGTYARQILDRLLIDLSWNSSRLEGNTYSLLETERLLQFGQATEGKDVSEAQMILNHKAAIEFLVDAAADIGFNRYTLLNLHALLSNNLLTDPRACGRLRNTPVGIARSVYLPLAVPQVIEECLDQILQTASLIQDPFEQAFFVMVHLPYLQPFDDVNKRVSRLSANLPLIRNNLSPLSFVDVPESLYIDGMIAIYELNNIELLKEVFVWAYERSCARYSAIRKTLGEPDPFRLKYRSLIFDTVAKTVFERLNRDQAIAFIKKTATESLPDQEQDYFIEVVETELMHLHEGNMARYRIRPSEYQAWQKLWQEG